MKNELIKVSQNEQGEQLVSGRELHEFLEVKSRFNDWIGNRVEKYGFIENSDYTKILVECKRGQNVYDYILKIDMAKELSMVENNEKGRQARRYFIECEKKLKEIGVKEKLLLGLFSDDKLVVAESHKQLVALELKPLQDKIEQDKPLVDFANQVSDNSDLILVRQFAKLLADENIKIGEKRLYQWFRDNNYVCKNSTEPTQRAIEQGLFKIVERIVKTPYGEKITNTTKITGKGQIYFTEKLRKYQ